jgi:cytochrome c551
MLARSRWLLALGAAALACAGCGGGDDGDAGDTGGGGDTANASGQAIFADNCARCHGADGTGGAGPDLTSLDEAKEHEAVVEQVTDGGGGMPSFKGDLSDAEIDAVATYVNTQIAGG